MKANRSFFQKKHRHPKFDMQFWGSQTPAAHPLTLWQGPFWSINSQCPSHLIPESSFQLPFTPEQMRPKCSLSLGRGLSGISAL